MTYGDLYHPIMLAQTREEAVTAFEKCITDRMVTNHLARDEAEKHERYNIGYFAGYYDNEARKRVEQWLQAAHPIFGPVTQETP
jgi:hypothetical protein